MLSAGLGLSEEESAKVTGDTKHYLEKGQLRQHLDSLLATFRHCEYCKMWCLPVATTVPTDVHAYTVSEFKGN